mgnify:CR=1 FL=1
MLTNVEKTFLGAAWAMALVTSIVLLVIAGGAVVVAVTAPAGAPAQLDAWRGALVCIVSLVGSSTLLAALTVARLRRGEELVIAEAVLEEALPAVVAIDADPGRQGRAL